jgi:hypothetical protein
VACRRSNSTLSSRAFRYPLCRLRRYNTVLPESNSRLLAGDLARLVPAAYLKRTDRFRMSFVSNHACKNAAGACIVAAALLAGCGQQDQITSYTVRKPELVDPTLVSRNTPPRSVSEGPFTQARSASEGPGSAAAITDNQTLGLIIPTGGQAWFFKLTGDVKAVASQHEAFISFVQSIKFPPSGGNPTWMLPDGWKQLPGSQFRFATIQLPAAAGEKPLEISVSSAGGEILANVNRWRQQLQLPPITAEELASTTKTLKIDGRDATLVSLVGKGSGQMGSAPLAPFAGGASLPPDRPPISKPGIGGRESGVGKNAPTSRP